MIGMFLGHQDSGKSLSMVYYAYDYYLKGYKIYSNLKLGFPYTLLTRKVLHDYTTNQVQFSKAIFLIDEIYLFLDSRSGFSKDNKVFSYLALQTSKRNINLFGTLQYFRTVDVRIREATTFQCFCSRVFKESDGLYYPVKSSKRKLTKEENEKLYIKNCVLKKVNEVFDYSINARKVYLKAKPLFKLYDTTELMAIE